MRKVSARAIDSQVAFPKGSELTRIEYSIGQLLVELKDAPNNKLAVVSFERVIGFRVLDESNLAEYWPTCSRQNGWLFEILDGGWLSQEAERSGIAQMNPQAREYLIAGQDDCVSIICRGIPVVQAGGSS